MGMNIRFFIAEDTRGDLDNLLSTIQNWAQKTNNTFEFVTTNRVSYQVPDEAMDCDVALLDVEIPEISGIEFAKALRKNNENILICFITSHSQFAINGYEVSAIDYILKPVNPNRFNRTLDKIAGVLQKNLNNVIRLKASNGYYTINTKSIIYIEANKHNCIFHMIDEDKQINIPISEVEQFLVNHDLYRVHRSYIVNLKYIGSFNRPFIKLTNGDSVPVGRSKIKEVQNLFLKYFGG